LEICIGKYKIQNKTKKKKKNFAQQVEFCCVVLHKTTHDAKRVPKKKQAQKYGRQSWFRGIFR
jgi:hypothetical protein